MRLHILTKTLLVTSILAVGVVLSPASQAHNTGDDHPHDSPKTTTIVVTDEESTSLLDGLAEDLRKYADVDHERVDNVRALTLAALNKRETTSQVELQALSNYWSSAKALVNSWQQACLEGDLNFERCVCTDVADVNYLSHNADYTAKLKQTLVPILTPNQMSDKLEDFAGFVLIATSSYTSDRAVQSDTRLLSSRSSVPTLLGIDGEGGAVSRFSWLSLPAISTLQTLTEAELCVELEKQAQSLTELGFNWNLAPVLDITTDKSSWIYSRTISSDSAVAATTGTSYVSCLQKYGLAATLKHFPGHGATVQDSHKTVPVVNKSYVEWQAYDGVPFSAALAAKPEFVMSGHLLYAQIDSEPASLSAKWLQEILKGELGYNGLVVTDDLAMLRPKNNAECKINIVKALNAGNDLVMVQHYYNCDLNKLVAEIAETRLVDETVLNPAYEKVMAYKQAKFCE